MTSTLSSGIKQSIIVCILLCRGSTALLCCVSVCCTTWCGPKKLSVVSAEKWSTYCFMLDSSESQNFAQKATWAVQCSHVKILFQNCVKNDAGVLLVMFYQVSIASTYLVRLIYRSCMLLAL